jgi:hypothetical protein
MAVKRLKKAIMTITITRIKNQLRPIVFNKTIYFFGKFFQFRAINYDLSYV